MVPNFKRSGAMSKEHVRIAVKNEYREKLKEKLAIIRSQNEVIGSEIKIKLARLDKLHEAALNK